MKIEMASINYENHKKMSLFAQICHEIIDPSLLLELFIAL